MGIQHLRTDKFLLGVQDTYRNVGRFFDPTDDDNWSSSSYSEEKSFYIIEARKLTYHIVGGKFTSELSRQKVEDELFAAKTLMMKLRPESPLIDDVGCLLNDVMSMYKDGN